MKTYQDKKINFLFRMLQFSKRALQKHAIVDIRFVMSQKALSALPVRCRILLTLFLPSSKDVSLQHISFSLGDCQQRDKSYKCCF